MRRSCLSPQKNALSPLSAPQSERHGRLEERFSTSAKRELLASDQNAPFSFTLSLSLADSLTLTPPKEPSRLSMSQSATRRALPGFSAFFLVLTVDYLIVFTFVL
jgi:hypothetical protein